ncbi:MAG: succinate dehydrogenase cytochrome b subunit [Bacteroidota bacterium]|nr:MAG: succinate dehydrogenase cytochrome b subunit [Bacteroidota bacterium]
MSNIFYSSIGKKLLMSLMGLFLISFLLVHLGINLLIITQDSFEPFNKAAHFMGTNKVIKIMEFALFGGFILHMVYGAVLSIQNMLSRPVGYKVANNSQLSFFSKYMFHTALVITIFLILHLFDFYIKAKFIGDVGEVVYDGKSYHDLGTLVFTRFKMLGAVVFYLVALLGLGFHLHHGFQSAFQTLGLNHPVYTPIIKGLGLLYTLVVTLGFMAIPVVIYFFK